MIKSMLNLGTEKTKFRRGNLEQSLTVANLEGSGNPLGFLRIRVSDTRQGIPADKLHPVFEKL
ncbi:MAG: hypothetical protein WCP85_13100 [Mariniphaga sp.]